MKLIVNRLYLSVCAIIMIFAAFAGWQNTIASHVYYTQVHERALRNWNLGHSCLKWDGEVKTDTYGKCYDLSDLSVKTSMGGAVFKLFMVLLITSLSMYFFRKWFLWAFNIKSEEASNTAVSENKADNVA